MKSWQRYFTIMQEVVENVFNTQEDNMAKAAKILASTTKNEGIIHLFGSGHSSLIAEDVFWRAATLACGISWRSSARHCSCRGPTCRHRN